MFAFGIDLGVFANNAPTYEDDTTMSQKYRLGPDSMNTYQAITFAIEHLEALAAQHDTASPIGHELRLALATLEAIQLQQGCEHLGADDGFLTKACDIAIFG